MRIWTRTPIGGDAGVQESVWVESNLTDNYKGGADDGFARFARRRGIAHVAMLNNNLGCNCLRNSSVGRQMAASCWTGTATDLPHSPVRDWWL